MWVRLPGIHEDLDSIPRGVKILNKQIKVKREMLLHSVRDYILKISFIFFIYVGVMLCVGVCSVCRCPLRPDEAIRSPLLELELQVVASPSI